MEKQNEFARKYSLAKSVKNYYSAELRGNHYRYLHQGVMGFDPF